MKTIVCVAAVLFCVWTGVASAGPAVSLVEPEVVVRGTRVSIHGSGFVPEGCTSSCAPSVTLGGQPAQLREYSPSRIDVIVPELPHEGAELVITTAAGESASRPSAVSVVDDPGGRLERVLLPVYLEGPQDGANGAIWATDFWMRNGGSRDTWAVHCGDCWYMPVARHLWAGETRKGIVARQQWWLRNPARFLYFETLDDVWMSLRLRELSRNEPSHDVKLPIVRDRDLRAGKIEILDVPVDGRSRLTLRIYDVAAAPTRFRVHVLPLSAGQRDRSVPVLSFDVTATGSNVEAFRDLPTYAEIDLASRLGLAEYGPVRVTIESLTPDSRFWAFVSITENATQRVTIATPE